MDDVAVKKNAMSLQQRLHVYPHLVCVVCHYHYCHARTFMCTFKHFKVHETTPFTNYAILIGMDFRSYHQWRTQDKIIGGAIQ
jgi:hypothetical protein